MGDLEKESFRKLESTNCDLADLEELVVLMLEDCFAFTVESLDHWDLIDKYRTAQTMSNAIFKLLHYQVKDSGDFINKVYRERKTNKTKEV